MMHKEALSFCFVLLGSFIAINVHAGTNSDDVSALNVMFTSLNSPKELSGWKSSGGDPCGDSWEGIECSGSSVTEIKLSGLKLSGSLGYQLSNLKSVTYFDVSKNKLKNDIPYQLPPNLEYLDLSENGFTNNVPYSISMMSDLKYLNLGHNQLNGDLTDMFKNLSKLTEMDVSFNKMTGSLPRSLGDLKSLTKLHLQNNQFTGTINILAKLPKLDDLNVENNKFTGWIPNELKGISKLKTDGNSWSSGKAPPPPPGTQPVKEGSGNNKSAMTGITIGGIALGVLIAIAVVIALISRRSSRSSHFIDDDDSDQRVITPRASREFLQGLPYVGSRKFRDRTSTDSNASIDIRSLQKSPSNGLRRSFSSRLQSFNDNEFAKRLNESRSSSFHAASYSLADLQTATGNFAPGRLLGEGSIGRVYRAKYSNGKVLAVKKIDSSLFRGMRPEEFSEIITSITKLKHQNIAPLFGYCTEQGQHMLIYEYFRNGSLHDFLHLSDDFSKPLTWNTRVRIALGTARAIEYLHKGCSPSILHKNIKSSNILLDMELNPRLSECGLATFHQDTTENLGAGYNAPECTTPSAYTVKSDVYSFGVVMLELLTGRKPFDSYKPRAEQSLVRWAAPQLHDIDALENMVDPALRGLYPPKSVSRFADTVALCVQIEPEFRPPISEVVQALVQVVQGSSMSYSPGTSRRTDDFDY